MDGRAIKAIETHYRGYLMRSRLEARWAIFFDSLGLNWEYEPQGVLLPNGIKYLPDFLINPPGIRPIFCEVKHGDICLGDPELRKPSSAADYGFPVLILNGPPDASRMWTIMKGNGNLGGIFFCDYDTHIIDADEYWFFQVETDARTGFCFISRTEYGIRKAFGNGLVDAVNAARSARFEYGGAHA